MNKKKKSEFRTFFLIPITFLFTLILTLAFKPVYAGADEVEEQEPIVWFDLETENGLFFGQKAQGTGWSYDGEYTLTLNNYSHEIPEASGGKTVIPNISIYAKGQTFNLVLEGDNYWPGELWIDYGTLAIQGTGTLKVENTILINRTTYYNYNDGTKYTIPEDEVYDGALTLSELYIKDCNGDYAVIENLELKSDGMQHYDIYGPSFIADLKHIVSKPVRTTVKSLNSNATKSMTIRIDNSTAIEGYEIILSESKKFPEDSRVVIASSEKAIVTKKIKKLTKGQKYYVKVRGFNLLPDGSKLYGKYSKVKSVTIK